MIFASSMKKKKIIVNNLRLGEKKRMPSVIEPIS